VDGYREVVGTNSVNVLGKIIQNSYHGYRKVVDTNFVNVSGKSIQNSYHGYKMVVGTNSVNVSGTNRPPHNKFQSSLIDWIKRPRRNQSTTSYYINITF
jgi:hypothetical protein